MAEKSFPDYIKIFGYIATASVFLSAVPMQATPSYTPAHYVNVDINPPSYNATAISFPTQNTIIDLNKELPIKGSVKVKIRNTQKKMEWN